MEALYQHLAGIKGAVNKFLPSSKKIITLDLIKEYIGLVTLLAAGLGAFFTLRNRMSNVELLSDNNKSNIEKLDEDIRQIQKNESANNATRDQMLEMLKENRLDVKMILQNIATLAASQNSKEKE